MKRRQCNDAVFIIITQKRYIPLPMQAIFMPFEKAMQAVQAVQASKQCKQAMQANNASKQCKQLLACGLARR
ncbi:MAG: hypothetical protein GY821_02505 [Gammaproteobacteria bacterium]|nr:hypothetical protein [Gammaproteobacteria bacterium]